METKYEIEEVVVVHPELGEITKKNLVKYEREDVNSNWVERMRENYVGDDPVGRWYPKVDLSNIDLNSLSDDQLLILKNRLSSL